MRAAKLAAHRRRGIRVLALVTVPASLPITAPMPDGEAATESVIEQAKVKEARACPGM
jgi:APA family basic amino acid/polyamine antiporter